MKAEKLSTWIVMITLVAIFFLGNENVAEAKKFRLVIGAGHPTTALWIARFQDFTAAEIKKRVAQRTGHEIEWVYAWGGSVAKLEGVLEAVETGLLDVGFIAYQFEPTKCQLQNWSNHIPFNTVDGVQLTRVTQKLFAQFPILNDMFEKKYHQKVFSFGAASGSYQLYTTFPVRKLEDLKGKKIAAAGPNLALLQGGIGVPVQSNLNEAYTSLQTGVYDGWIIYADAGYNFKLHEVAPYLTLTDFGCVSGSAQTVNLDKWKSLPKEIQDIFLEVGREVAMDYTKASDAKIANTYVALKQKGVPIYQLPFEEKVKWSNRLPDLPNKNAKELDANGFPGSQIYKAFFKLMKEEGYKFPRTWNIN
jgi:TRAP-type C4-dicarboxylate transport system substrate-binding protein